MSDLIWIPLAEFDPKEEGEIGIRKMDAEEHDKFVMKHSGHQMAEAKRKAEARKGLSAEEAPELYAPGFMTPEGMGAMLALSKEIYLAAVKEIRGRSESVPELYQALEMRVRVQIFGRLISSQVPSRRELPPS